MALVLLALLPLYMIIGKATAHFISKYFVKSQNAYAKAGAVAEQAFQSIRTIYSFTLQKRFLERYEVALEEALGFSIKRGWSIGLGFAMLYLVLFCGYGLSLWFGSGLVMKGELDGPSVFVVFLSMLTSMLF
jgi:ABC-type bacteriocin/lantibiotic exporter with double-glycine peptidase domain